MKRLPTLSGNVKMKHMILIAVYMTLDQVTKGESSIALTCKHKMSPDMSFPTMWHFDKCRLRQASAASC